MRNKINYEERRNKRQKKENNKLAKVQKMKEKEDMMLKFGILYEYNKPEDFSIQQEKKNKSRLSQRRERIKNLKKFSRINSKNDLNKIRKSHSFKGPKEIFK